MATMNLKYFVFIVLETNLTDRWCSGYSICLAVGIRGLQSRRVLQTTLNVIVTAFLLGALR